MSAFLCRPYHVGRLAAFFTAGHDSHEGYLRAWIDGPEIRPAQWTAEPPAVLAAQVLADANWRSVAHRYPNLNGEHLPGPVGIENRVEYLLACRQAARLPWNPTVHRPLDIAKAVDCYRYQSCEHPEWLGSTADHLSREILSRAVCEMPGYDRADGWELKEPAEPPAVPLEILRGRA